MQKCFCFYSCKWPGYLFSPEMILGYFRKKGSHLHRWNVKFQAVDHLFHYAVLSRSFRQSIVGKQFGCLEVRKIEV